MNEILKIICWIVLGILASSFVFAIIIKQHEQGHRNFEYIQCKQFQELAINTNKTYGSFFDCDFILKEGVLKFKLNYNNNNFERELIKKTYAYQDYVDEYKQSEDKENDLCN